MKQEKNLFKLLFSNTFQLRTSFSCLFVGKSAVLAKTARLSDKVVIVTNIPCHSEPGHSGEESYNIPASKNYRLFGSASEWYMFFIYIYLVIQSGSEESYNVPVSKNYRLFGRRLSLSDICFLSIYTLSFRAWAFRRRIFYTADKMKYNLLNNHII